MLVREKMPSSKHGHLIDTAGLMRKKGSEGGSFSNESEKKGWDLPDNWLGLGIRSIGFLAGHFDSFILG